MKKISLAVIIVSYNVCAQLEDCLRSVEQSAVRRPGWLTVETLVVEIDRKRIEEVRRNWPFLRDRRIDAYAGMTKRFLDE